MYAAATAQVLARLSGAGIVATDDPGKAASNRPCVLVPPPGIDLTTGAATHELVCLSSHQLGSKAAVDQLAGLVGDVAAALPVETGRPAGYPLTPETGTVPAYLLTLTTTL